MLEQASMLLEKLEHSLENIKMSSSYAVNLGLKVAAGHGLNYQNVRNICENDYQRVLNKFKNKDNEIRTHEQTHASLGTTTAPINYNFQVGPDGKLYAMGGSVRFDTSIPSNPENAKVKLEELRDASSSVSPLSGADASIAQTTNLNKMLLESIKEGYSYENR